MFDGQEVVDALSFVTISLSFHSRAFRSSQVGGEPREARLKACLKLSHRGQPQKHAQHDLDNHRTAVLTSGEHHGKLYIRIRRICIHSIETSGQQGRAPKPPEYPLLPCP